MSSFLELLGHLGELAFLTAESVAAVRHDPHVLTVTCFDLRGAAPFTTLEEAMDPTLAEDVSRVVARSNGSLFMTEGHAVAVTFTDPSPAIDAWLGLLRMTRASTGHGVSGGLFVGLESSPDDLLALGREAAALADAAGPGELLSSHEPSDPDLVVKRVGEETPAIYSIRART